MASASNSSETEFQNVLGTALIFRCHKLYVLINDSSTRELQNLFPQLIYSIFYSDGGKGWDLRNITQYSNQQDFQILQDFFNPLGPMFRLCYKLLEDHYVKFELPVTYLPNEIQVKLQSGDVNDVPMFYSDVLISNTTTPSGMSLQLNAFDYYMFNFALHLSSMAPSLGPKNISSFMPSKGMSIYHVLCSDYLQHFLPTCVNTSVLPMLSVYCNKPVKVCSAQPTRQTNTSRLIRIGGEIVPPPHPVTQNSRNHWRSETVLVVFTDMWLCSDLVIAKQPQDLYGIELVNDILPDIDYIKIIRMMVKQFHGFALSGQYDTSSFAELKLTVWGIYQDKMYTFLRQMIKRWPLDNYFILVIEAWLSFIQPWRYHPLRQRDSEIVIDRFFIGFISDNILAYTQIFLHILSRFEHLDLDIGRNATMLYRVFKVFSQTTLPSMLYEIETNLNNQSSDSFSPLKQSGIHDYHHSHLSPNDSNLVVRRRMLKLEGNDFNYQNMFSEQVVLQVTKLLKNIQQSIRQAHKSVAHMKTQQMKNCNGFWNWIQNQIFDPNPLINLENSIREKSKVPGYLDLSAKHLCEIFNLDYEFLLSKIREDLDASEIRTSQSQMNLSANSTFLETPVLCNTLTPAQMKEHAKQIRYMGDPDLLPVSSSEITFLVRIFFHLSKRINNAFERELSILWYRDSFSGRIARQILNPPMIVRKFDKTKPGYSPLTSTSLPPRLSLRFLAKMRLWVNIGLITLAAYYYGVPILVTFFLILVTYCLFVMFKALIYDSTPQTNNFDQSY